MCNVGVFLMNYTYGYFQNIFSSFEYPRFIVMAEEEIQIPPACPENVESVVLSATAEALLGIASDLRNLIIDLPAKITASLAGVNTLTTEPSHTSKR